MTKEVILMWQISRLTFKVHNLKIKINHIILVCSFLQPLPVSKP